MQNRSLSPPWDDGGVQGVTPGLATVRELIFCLIRLGARDEQCSHYKKRCAVAESNRRSENRPQRPHDDAGNEVADAVNCSEDAESHSVVAFIHQFGA